MHIDFEYTGSYAGFLCGDKPYTYERAKRVEIDLRPTSLLHFAPPPEGELFWDVDCSGYNDDEFRQFAIDQFEKFVQPYMDRTVGVTVPIECDCPIFTQLTTTGSRAEKLRYANPAKWGPALPALDEPLFPALVWKPSLRATPARFRVGLVLPPGDDLVAWEAVVQAEEMIGESALLINEASLHMSFAGLETIVTTQHNSAACSRALQGFEAAGGEIIRWVIAS